MKGSIINILIWGIILTKALYDLVNEKPSFIRSLIVVMFLLGFVFWICIFTQFFLDKLEVLGLI